jgi:hypothetical protein
MDFDVSPHVGGALGNVYTYANAGFTLRYGKDLTRDYGPPRVQPGVLGSVFFEPTNRFSTSMATLQKPGPTEILVDGCKTVIARTSRT